MAQEPPHPFDKPENLRRLLRALYLACLLVLGLDLLIHRHVVHGWERLWGFYGLYGFAACVTLVLIAKLLRKILQRAEDFYDH